MLNTKFISILILFTLLSLAFIPFSAGAQSSNISVDCNPSTDQIEVGDYVNWTASVNGGSGSYSYQWGSGSTFSNTQTYHSAEGVYTQSLTVSDGNSSRTALCRVTIGDGENNDDNNNSDDNRVECRVSDTNIRTGERVTFEALVDGSDRGNSYEYDWDWDVDGDSQSINRSYSREDSYRARLTVREDNGSTITGVAVCPTIRVSDDFSSADEPLEVSCRVSDTNTEVGDIVDFFVEVEGGNSPYNVEWTGDISGSRPVERARFIEEGIYETRVIVEDYSGNRRSVNCKDVNVGRRYHDNNSNNDENNITTTAPVNNNNGNNSNNYGSTDLGQLASAGQIYRLSGTSNPNTVYDAVDQVNTQNSIYGHSPNANLASLNAVQLSQVPYTGPSDVIKVLGVLALLALLTTLFLNFQFKKLRKEKVVSNHIEAFKLQNKKSVSIG